MSFRIVPASSAPHTTTQPPSAPSAPGIHDTLRANLHLTSTSSTTSLPTSSHPLESRLAAWRTTQESLKMRLLRVQYGLAEPVKRQMELSIVRQGEWRPACLGGGMGGGVHADILSGRDWEMGWEDVFHGEGGMEGTGFHAEMEGRFGVL